MTFLAPGFLAAGAAGALVAVALHLIALQRPRRALLPTARFIPETAARASSLTRLPSDLMLLCLRVLALLALGAAFARPVPEPARAPLRQIVVVDRSDAVGDVQELRDSVAARAGQGDVVILVDSAARATPLTDGDSLATLTLARGPALLSAGLIAARRMAVMLADSTDSVRVVVISPFASEAADSALRLVRAGWPGRIDLVRLSPRVDSGSRVTIELPPGDDEDPLVAGLRHASIITSAPVRLVRTVPLAADSAAARDGAVLLVWPAQRPVGWSDRAVVDTVGAVVAGRATVVAPFVREWTVPATGAVVARWVDGEPAAVEESLGVGCIRTVGVPLSRRGDLTIGAPFGALLRELTSPCGGTRLFAPLAPAIMRELAGEGASVIPVPEVRVDRDSQLARWLLGLAILLLAMEWVLRGVLTRRAEAAGGAPVATAGARAAGRGSDADRGAA